MIARAIRGLTHSECFYYAKAVTFVSERDGMRECIMLLFLIVVFVCTGISGYFDARIEDRKVSGPVPKIWMQTFVVRLLEG